MKITDIIRYFLTTILLYIVWLNSHWSVALSITLVSISMEIVRYILSKMVNLLTDK